MGLRALKKNLLSALEEIVRGAKLWRQWKVLAEAQLGRRFQKSILGKGWELINFVLTVTVLGYLFSVLFNREFESYWLYLAAGFATWLLISSVLSEGASVFVRNMVFVRELPLPMSIYLWAQLWKCAQAYAINITFAMLLGLWINGPSVALLLVAPGFLLILVISYFLIMIFGVLGARYRDAIHFVPNILRGIFFLTPILWTLDRRQNLVWLVDYNPFYYLLEIVRAPLLGVTPEIEIYYVTIGILLVTVVIALTLYAAVHKKMVYWL